MLEPTWGAIIVYALNSIVTIVVMLKLISKLPCDTGCTKRERVEWATYAERGKRVKRPEPEHRSGFEWLSEEQI